MKFKIGDLVRPCYDPERVETFDLRDDPSPIGLVVGISKPFHPHLNEEYYEIRFFDESLLPALHTRSELELIS